MEAHCELVDPRRPSTAFSVLHTAYTTAKRLVKQYGNVRVFSAEDSHRPAGTCVEVSNVFLYTHARARNRTEFSHVR
jgi:DNA mismatch repair ATPase MutL